MKTKEIFFANLPTDITEDELQRELLEKFKVYQDAYSRGDKINVVIYRNWKDPEKPKTMAVVSGVYVDVDRLHSEAVGLRCVDRNWVFKRDFGDERDDDGEFIRKLAPPKRRLYDYLTGISMRLVRPAFNVDVLQLLNNTFSSTRSVYIDKEVDYDVLTKIFSKCVLENTISIYSKNMTRCFFVSALDALQAIVAYNGTSIKKGTIRFTDENKTQFATINWQCGLGEGGDMLDIFAFKLKEGYVPLEVLSTLIFNINGLLQIPSYCWKCEKPFKIIGIDVNLKFVAGRCGCLYIKSLDVNHEHRAFFWENEDFTRLVPGKIENGIICNLIISHETMMDYYPSEKEYRRIIFPILREEWSYSTQHFKDNYTVEGRFLEFERIQFRREDDNAVFGAIIRVRKTEFWNQQSFKEIGELTLNFIAIERGREKLEERAAKLLQMRENVDLNVTDLFVQFRLNEFQNPSQQTRAVVVVPKPVKVNYDSNRRLLNKWRNKPRKYPHFNVLLYKSLWFEPAPGPPSVTLNINDPDLRQIMVQILDTLNGEQMGAVAIGTANPLAIVIGPPGTGKTFTSAVICLFRRLQDNLTVLATAPSNFAVDGLATKISTLLENNNIRLKVLRVYSRKHGEQFLRTNSTPDLGRRVRCLHERVVNNQRYLNSAFLQRIHQLIETNRMHLLTIEEREFYEKEYAEIEAEILGQADMILCTVGVLQDMRIRNWNKTSKKIGALLLDEGGMVLQPDLLTVFDMRQKSTIIVGDPSQLSPVVTSYAAELTGYQLSALEWFQISGIPIPTVTLLEQHRMATPIRILVSKLSYDDKLRDNPSVWSIPGQLFLDYGNAMNTTKNILVYNHDYVEEKSDNRIRNTREAKLIVQIVHQLRHAGISDEDVTVLSLYEWQRRYLVEKGVSAKTVDSFQGRENKIIILSMTRGGGEIGFSSRLNRLNVALSRAKHFLIVTMNWTTFGRHKGQAIQKFLTHLSNPKYRDGIEIRNANEHYSDI